MIYGGFENLGGAKMKKTDTCSNGGGRGIAGEMKKRAFAKPVFCLGKVYFLRIGVLAP
jgi:hypothetical protein